MKAVLARAFGPPETFAIEDVPRVPLNAEDVRIETHYAGVSFVDVLTAAGRYQLELPLPFIPGSEVAGIVREVGSAVRGIVPGDAVCGGALGGVFAEEIVLPAHTVQKVPHGRSLMEAAVLRASYVTAYYALTRRAHLQTDETVLVLGAGGAVGIAAIQLAVLMGAKPIASASSEAKRALALENGALHAIDSRADDWRSQVKALTGGKGVDVVVDTLGGEFTERAFRALRWNGRHLVIGFAAGTIPSLPVNLALLKGAALIGVDLRQFGINEPAAFAAMCDEVLALFARDAVRPPIDRVFPFDDFRAAMAAAAKGDSAGRILLRMPAAAG
jgi:NADPH2:quinone reductase